MNLFFTKKDQRIAELERENIRLSNLLDYANDTIRDITRLRDNTQEDCIKGPWCQSCEFVKSYRIYGRRDPNFTSVKLVYICGKAESCPNFVQREVKE